LKERGRVGCGVEGYDRECGIRLNERVKNGVSGRGWRVDNQIGGKGGE